jgi:hypothetical protein
VASSSSSANVGTSAVPVNQAEVISSRRVVVGRLGERSKVFISTLTRSAAPVDEVVRNTIFG